MLGRTEGENLIHARFMQTFQKNEEEKKQFKAKDVYFVMKKKHSCKYD